MPRIAYSQDGVKHVFDDGISDAAMDAAMGAYAKEHQPPTYGGEILKGAARGPLDFAGQFLDFAMETNPVTRPLVLSKMVVPSHLVERFEEKAGLEKSDQASLGQAVAGSVAEAVTNPTSWAGPGSFGTKALGAVLSGAGEEGLGELAHATVPGLEPYARMLGGALGGHTAGSLERSAKLREGEAKLKDSDKLKESSQKAYAELQTEPVSVTPQGMTDLNQRVMADLTQEHFTPVTARRTFNILHKNFRSGRDMNETERVNGINGQIGQIDANLQWLKQNTSARSTVTKRLVVALNTERARLEQERSRPFAAAARSRRVSDLIAIYEQLGKIHPAVDPADANAAQIARAGLREWIEEHATKGVGRKLQKALGNWAAYKKVEEIETGLEIGQHRAEVSGSGFNVENTMRQEIRKILDNPRRLRGYTAAEKDQMAEIVRGSFMANLARMMGRQSWINSPMSTIVLSFFNAPLAAGMYAGTVGSRKLGEFLTAGEIQRLITMIKERAPANSWRARQNRRLRQVVGPLPTVGAVRGAGQAGMTSDVQSALESAP